LHGVGAILWVVMQTLVNCPLLPYVKKNWPLLLASLCIALSSILHEISCLAISAQVSLLWLPISSMTDLWSPWVPFYHSKPPSEITEIGFTQWSHLWSRLHRFITGNLLIWVRFCLDCEVLKITTPLHSLPTVVLNWPVLILALVGPVEHMINVRNLHLQQKPVVTEIQTQVLIGATCQPGVLPPSYPTIPCLTMLKAKIF